jgi:hypothetical protein
VVNMRVYAVYNVIVECFFYYSLFKNKKKITYISSHENLHIRYAVAYRIYGMQSHTVYAVCSVCDCDDLPPACMKKFAFKNRYIQSNLQKKYDACI